MMELSFDSPESKSIIRGDYDPNTNTATVEFASGDRYQFPGVSSELWTEWAAAKSKGQFFHARIRPHIQGVKL